MRDRLWKWRRKLRSLLPDHASVHDNRWLAPFAGTLLHPRLWHLNRHSVAGAVAAGLFCGLIPGPLQMLGAALCAVAFRINLPLAMITTLYSNPLTIVPLYVLAFGLGEAALTLAVGAHASDGFIPPPPYTAGDPLGWIKALAHWIAELGLPLAVGLVLLATLLAFAGYVVVRMVWRWHIVRAWRHRPGGRERAAPSP